MAKRKILLTGFTGQVGSDLLKIVPPGYEVVCARRHGEDFLDLTDAAALRTFVRDVKPNIILNPAAYTAVDKAESEQALAHAVNAEAPGVLAEEAKTLGALLVHYSTDYVFNGDPAHDPWREDDNTGPLNVYGRTKLEGEERVRSSGCPHMIFRTSWVYGVHGHNFLKTIKRLASEREALTIVSDQIGAPTTSDFLARMTWLAVEKWAASEERANLEGTFHLTCSGHCSWYDFACEIVKQARANGEQLKVESIQPIPTAEYKTPAARPLNSRLDCSKFERAFGVTELQRWDEALRIVVSALS